MKITALLENTTSRDDLMTEHGLSLYIETANHHILFDMGQTGLFAENARMMNIDLTAVDIAVLSHGHYDHGGGLKTFLALNSQAPVYVNRYAFEAHYNGCEKYIGLDTSLAESDRLTYVDDRLRIDHTLSLFSCNEKERKHGMGSFGLNQIRDGSLIPDDFRHEQYLLIEEGRKRVLLSGCSHKGILDIVSWFKPDCLIGGFHYSKLETGRVLADAARLLDSYQTEYYTCHCTGIVQFTFMKEHMRNLHYLSCGQTIEI